MRAHYVPEDLCRCEREGGLCGSSTGAVCISPLRHRRLFALPTLFLHPHRFLSPSPPSPPPPCSTIINCFRIPLNLFVCIILCNVHLSPPPPLQHHHQLLPHPAQPLCLHHPLQRAPLPPVGDVRTLRRIPSRGSRPAGEHPPVRSPLSPSRSPLPSSLPLLPSARRRSRPRGSRPAGEPLLPPPCPPSQLLPTTPAPSSGEPLPSLPPRSLPLPPRSPALRSRPYTAPVCPPLEWACHLAGHGSMDL